MNQIPDNNRTAAYLRTLKGFPLLEAPARRLLGDIPPEDVLQRTNLLVFTPVMHAYVTWILREAVRLGIRRLYFLARDGYLVYQTACRYCSSLGLDVECRYLYCSRFALRQPMYHQNLDEALDYICRGGLSITPTKLMIRAGLSQEDIAEIYPHIGLEYQPDQPVPYAHLNTIQEQLRQSRIFTDRVSRNSREALPALEGYFRQEGLLDDCPGALVDCGWTGSMQKSICQIRSLFGCTTPLNGFYFGMYFLPGDCDPAAYHCFYFAPHRHLLRKALFNNNLLEVVFSAPHGTTCGYRREEGAYVPVLSQPQPRIQALLLQLSARMDAYTELFLEGMTPERFFRLSIPRLARTSAGLLRRLMFAPSVPEAQAYGTLPFSDDMLDDRPVELAAAMLPQELRDYHLVNRVLGMLGFRRLSLRESAWFEASAVRSVPHAALHRCNFALYKLLIHFRQMFRK